jgi:hypothetical protein
MEFLGFAGFAAVFLMMIWLLSRLMAATGRNDELTHGGGVGGSTFGGGD